MFSYEVDVLPVPLARIFPCGSCYCGVNSLKITAKPFLTSSLTNLYVPQSMMSVIFSKLHVRYLIFLFKIELPPVPRLQVSYPLGKIIFIV